MFKFLEQSVQDAAPYEIYEFTRDAQKWFYTTRSKAHTVNLQPYQPLKVTRSDLEYTNEVNKTNIQITVPRDNPVAGMFLHAPPGNVVQLMITRRHIGLDGADDQEVLWRGRILDVDWQARVAQMTGEPIFTSLRRVGLRRHYQRSCPHVLYGDKCGVKKKDFMYSGQAGGLSGTTVDLPSLEKQDGTFVYPDGWFAGGYLEYRDSDNALNYQMILHHTGRELQLVLPARGLVQGTEVEVYAGCAHTTEACTSKFNNMDRYGGFPFMPTSNPFAGVSVF